MKRIWAGRAKAGRGILILMVGGGGGLPSFLMRLRATLVSCIRVVCAFPRSHKKELHVTDPHWSFAHFHPSFRHHEDGTLHLIPQAAVALHSRGVAP
mgnify:CR=1 FL=1